MLVNEVQFTNKIRYWFSVPIYTKTDNVSQHKRNVDIQKTIIAQTVKDKLQKAYKKHTYNQIRCQLKTDCRHVRLVTVKT